MLPEKSKLEPGHLMIAFAVRRAIEQQRNMIDFLRGNQPYKAYWGADPSRKCSLRFSIHAANGCQSRVPLSSGGQAPDRCSQEPEESPRYLTTLAAGAIRLGPKADYFIRHGGRTMPSFSVARAV